ELVAGADGLGDLVLVVREDEVQPAAVNVEGGAEISGGHGRALEVPAGPAASPGRRPGRLAGLGPLPQGEVARIALAALALGVAGRVHGVQLLPGQGAV